MVEVWEGPQMSLLLVEAIRDYQVHTLKGDLALKGNPPTEI
jgi:hypothetical protein